MISRNVLSVSIITCTEIRNIYCKIQTRSWHVTYENVKSENVVSHWVNAESLCELNNMEKWMLEVQKTRKKLVSKYQIEELVNSKV